MERIDMQYRVLRLNMLGELDRLYREKAQFTEQLEQNEINIQRHIGAITAVDKCTKVVKEIRENDAGVDPHLPIMDVLSKDCAEAAGEKWSTSGGGS